MPTEASAWFHEGSKLRRHDRRQLRAMLRPVSPLQAPSDSANLVGLESVGESLELPPIDRILQHRRSIREFTGDAMCGSALRTLIEKGLCGNASGPAGELRPYPSAGGLYPVRVHVWVNEKQAVAAGLYRLHPEDRAVEWLRDLASEDLAASCFYPETLRKAACVLILSVVMDRATEKYLDRGYRYSLLEAGHMAQNILLLATAVGAGAVPLGGYIDGEIEDFLKIDGASESLLYLIPVGMTKEQNHQPES